MYTNGELEEVMKSFEKTLKVAPVYVGGGTDRADKVEVTLESGRISKQYRNNNYYNDGHINQFFILFLHGYAAGKCVGLSEQ